MTTKEKVIQVTTLFGMKGEKAAELMGISYGAYRNKKKENATDRFTESNYSDLTEGIKKIMLKYL